MARAKGGDRASVYRKKTKEKKTIEYAICVPERSVVCGIIEKDGKQERMEDIEAKNLANGRTLTTRRMVDGKLFPVRLNPSQTEFLLLYIPSGVQRV